MENFNFWLHGMNLPLSQNSIWPPPKIKIIIKGLLSPVLVNLNKKKLKRKFHFVLKSWVNLFEKESNMVTPKNRTLLKVPYRPFNSLKHRQIRQFDNKNNRGKPWHFNLESWVNPFGRIQYGHPQNWTCQKRVFPAIFALFNFMKHLFRLYFEKNTIKKRLSNFAPKSWVNPFGRIQYGHTQNRPF